VCAGEWVRAGAGGRVGVRVRVRVRSRVHVRAGLASASCGPDQGGGWSGMRMCGHAQVCGCPGACVGGRAWVCARVHACTRLHACVCVRTRIFGMYATACVDEYGCVCGAEQVHVCAQTWWVYGRVGTRTRWWHLLTFVSLSRVRERFV